MFLNESSFWHEKNQVQERRQAKSRKSYSYGTQSATPAPRRSAGSGRAGGHGDHGNHDNQVLSDKGGIGGILGSQSTGYGIMPKA